ncbi:MAG: hypothetical protein QHJ82_04990, partial [Verrucomicrobiota bacterium]|nr:hypothetical protein [Verrucomicrobiota bacterium]
VRQRALHPRQRRVQCGLDQGAFPSDGVAGHISKLGVVEGPGGTRALGFARWATLVPATPGWGICGLAILAMVD